MFWYGFFFFFFFFFLIIYLTFFLLQIKLYSLDLGFFIKSNINTLLGFSILVGFIFSLNYLYVYFTYLISFNFSNLFGLYDSTLLTSSSLISFYYFPYIYIFLFITLLSIITCLAYNNNESFLFITYCLIITMAGIFVFFTNSILVFFLAYEMLLLPSFFILYRFAKTRRSIEAAYLMFFWTQFGALFLIITFLFIFLLSNSIIFSDLQNIPLSRFEHQIIVFLLIIGFGVKLPIWPFYGWLPKAHVEASTNFSIFLSGVLVKIAFFSLFRCLVELQMEVGFIEILPLLIVGLFDSLFKMFYQIDLKKLVAYSTVVEMHWLTICIFSGFTPLLLAGFCMLISHALISSNSFFLVDSINRRFKTRLITEVSGISILCPHLFILILINTLLFFVFLLDQNPIFFLLILPLLYLLGPIFFFRSWSNVMFGSSSFLMKKIPLDASNFELILCGGVEILLIWLGLTWQFYNY